MDKLLKLLKANALESPQNLARMLGIPAGEVSLDWARDVIFKGITIHAVNGRRMYDTWYQCQNFLMKDRLSVDPVITHILPFEKFQTGFDLIHAGKAGKIVLTLASRDGKEPFDTKKKRR